MPKTQPKLRAKGEKLAPLSERLARLGLRTDWDYVLHLPLRYEDETRIARIAEVQGGMTAQIQGEVIRCETVPTRAGPQVSALVKDDTGVIGIRLLHFYPSQLKALEVGRVIRAYGLARDGFRGLEMVHPRIKPPVALGELPVTLTPVYPAGESVTQNWLRKRIARALLDVDIVDLIDAASREELRLMEFKEAVLRLHRPPVGADEAALSERTDPAWTRLKFDELLAQQIALKLSRRAKAQAKAPVLERVRGAVADAFYRSLPFALTAAQKRVAGEIAADLKKDVPMHRLIQGDVGSGKTVVAAIAAALAIDAGSQVALMAPTEILAEQHYLKLARLFEPFGITPVWLTGSLSAKAKREALAAIASGEAKLVVGTHALIQDKVAFKNLGLAIVDEQHRFGVRQRLALRSREDGLVPHLLMMSATPIPRTLAMSYFADTDVSVIDELPPGRTPVETRLISQSRREEVIAMAASHAASGRQLFWVCPLIEESEKVDLAAANDTYEELRAKIPGAKVGLLHGRMDPEDKARVMAGFASGEIAVLVSTTVVEVGVDVPNATCMVIEHAERFGLAQLHQLRGRVGRGAQKSFCILVYGDLSQDGRARLKIIRESADGFAIAREDLRLRGPGEFLGARQSGVPLLRFADIEADALLLEKARRFADRFLNESPAKAREQANRWFGYAQHFLEA